MKVKTKTDLQLAEDIIEHNVREGFSQSEIAEMIEKHDQFAWDKLVSHGHTELFEYQDECDEFCREHADEIFACMAETLDERLDTVSGIISGFVLVGLWCDLIDWDDDDYDNAKEKLLSRGFERPCIEEILAQILADGKSIYVCCDDGKMPLTQKMIDDALSKRLRDKTIDDILEDNEECDAVIQTALFGEVVYG
jgi:hypothetical protein